MFALLLLAGCADERGARLEWRPADAPPPQTTEIAATPPPDSTTSPTSGTTPADTPPATTPTETGETKGTKGTDTAAAGPRRNIVVFGDQGTGDDSQQEVADAVAAFCDAEGCERVLGTGDNFYPSGVVDVADDQFSTAFEEPYDDVDTLFWMTLGNHDYLGSIDAQVAYTTKSAKWRMPASYYHATDAQILFVALDTNQPTEKQAREIQAEISGIKATWTFFYGHHPLRSNGTHGDAEESLAAWLEGLLCERADLYLAGHDHNLQHLDDECGVGLLVSGGGAKTPYPITKADNSLFGAASRGFLGLSITDAELEMTFYDETGAALYSATRAPRSSGG